MDTGPGSFFVGFYRFYILMETIYLLGTNSCRVCLADAKFSCLEWPRVSGVKFNLRRRVPKLFFVIINYSGRFLDKIVSRDQIVPLQPALIVQKSFCRRVMKTSHVTCLHLTFSNWFNLIQLYNKVCFNFVSYYNCSD